MTRNSFATFARRVACTSRTPTRPAANNPGLGAYAVMTLDSGGADREVDAMMIMSMPKDAAWPDSVIDSHR